MWEAQRQGRFVAYVSAITPVNIFYIARKLRGIALAQQVVTGLVCECRIVTIDDAVLRTALTLPTSEF